MSQVIEQLQSRFTSAFRLQHKETVGIDQGEQIGCPALDLEIVDAQRYILVPDVIGFDKGFVILDGMNAVFIAIWGVKGEDAVKELDQAMEPEITENTPVPEDAAEAPEAAEAAEPAEIAQSGEPAEGAEASGLPKQCVHFSPDFCNVHHVWDSWGYRACSPAAPVSPVCLLFSGYPSDSLNYSPKQHIYNLCPAPHSDSPDHGSLCM